MPFHYLSYITLSEHAYGTVSVLLINQLFYSPIALFQVICETEEKFLRLLELLGLYQEDGSVLVFVDKQEHADEV